MPRKSAGLLLYRRNPGDSGLEVLLVHPGGPFWRNKDEGAWSIPKGEFGDHEEPLTAAKREFEEETGAAAPDGKYLKLETVKQAGGKIVHAWAVEGDFDPANLRSNTFRQEWPPKSGKVQEVPEIDRAEWCSTETARTKILASQIGLVDELLTISGK